MMRTLRIGSGAGYGGDRIEPALAVMEHGDIQYIIFECLAERTIALAQQQRSRHPDQGYNELLTYRMRHVLPLCSHKHIKVITNMGAANPRFEFGWDTNNYELLGRGTLAGHLLECGAQVTGGYFADPGYKDVADLAHLGFPIVEVTEDGDVTVTKLADAGGNGYSGNGQRADSLRNSRSVPLSDPGCECGFFSGHGHRAFFQPRAGQWGEWAGPQREV